MKQNVVFLDIDGVLNSSFSEERIGRVRGVSDKHIKVLKEIVDFLDADIVLSSSWKDFWNENLINDGVNNWRGRSKFRYGRYLNIRLGEFGLKIVDKTETLPAWYDRAREIILYLDKHSEIGLFVILDDENFRWRSYQLDNHWISTWEKDDDYYMWGTIKDGLEEKHFEYLKNNLDKFKR